MGVMKKAIYRKSAPQIFCKESNFSLHAPFSRGERLIVLHAGSKAGFLKGTELVWKAGISTPWPFRYPQPVKMSICIASSPRLSGTGMTSLNP